MKKTSLLVFNLTIAGLLEIEIAAADADTLGSTDDTRARASPEESRIRLGVEQTVARFQRYSYADIDSGDTALSWGLGAFDLALDFRAIDRFEIGVAAGAWGSHWSSDGGNGIGASSTNNRLRLNPRAGYGIPLDSRLALVPRVGAEYVRASSSTTGNQLGVVVSQTFTSQYVSLTSGLMLEYRPVPWLFVAPLADFNYRVHSNLDGDSTWLSDQPLRVWSLDLKLAAGVRI